MNGERTTNVPVKRHRGGQPGNQNAKGRKNRRGGAPYGNQNAWKHGGYAITHLRRAVTLYRIEKKLNMSIKEMSPEQISVLWDRFYIPL